jgi:hypothetical protein
MSLGCASQPLFCAVAGTSVSLFCVVIGIFCRGISLAYGVIWIVVFFGCLRRVLGERGQLPRGNYNRRAGSFAFLPELDFFRRNFLTESSHI